MLGRDRDAGVVADHLEADLVHHLGNRRVHLPRHDGAAGLDGREPHLVEARARSAREQPQIAGDLAEVDRERAQLPAERGRVAHALHELDAVLALAQVESGDRPQVLDHEPRILGLGVDPGADGGAADPQVAQVIRRALDAPAVALDRSTVGAELLAEPDRHGVLEVRAPRLEDVVELLSLGEERIAQRGEGIEERAELRERAEPDGGGDHVVGGLRHVDVIVGVHGGIAPARAA